MDFPKSVPSVGLVDGKFVDEDVVAGTPGSLIPAQWGNAVTEEVLNVIESAGLNPDEEVNDQLITAINQLITDAIPDSPAAATELAAGIVKLSALVDDEAGTNADKAVTPIGVRRAIAKVIKQATEVAAGWAKVATQALVNEGLNDTDIVTPLKLAKWASDPWSMQPIGVPIPLLDNNSTVQAPATDKGYRYIRLSAGDAYNTGVLVSEVVSGSAPMVVATGVVSLAGSPLNGIAINLINTERRVLRAGVTGVTEQDQFQAHWHDYWYANGGRESGGTVLTDGLNAAATIRDARGATYIRVRDAVSDGVNGAVRVGNETRAKSIGMTFYMRIK